MCMTNNTAANIAIAGGLVAGTALTFGTGAPAAAGAVKLAGADAVAATAGAGASAGASWLPYAGLGMSLLGTGASAYGQYQSGKAANAASEYNAKIMQNNAIYAGYQAQDARRRGELEKTRIREEAARLKGQGRVAFGSGNVLLGSGSPQDWENDMNRAVAMDLDTVDTNTNLAVWGYGEQAKGYQSQAQLMRLEGGNAARSGMYSAGGSLLSGAGTVADRWYTYKRLGGVR